MQVMFLFKYEEKTTVGFFLLLIFHNVPQQTNCTKRYISSFNQSLNHHLARKKDRFIAYRFILQDSFKFFDSSCKLFDSSCKQSCKMNRKTCKNLARWIDKLASFLQVNRKTCKNLARILVPVCIHLQDCLARFLQVFWFIDH